VIRYLSFKQRLNAFDFRFLAGSLSLVGRGVAWCCAFIAVLFAGSKMPLLFRRIPPEIQFACELLVTLAIVFLVRMLIERRHALRAYAELGDTLSRFVHSSREERATGVSPERMDQIRTACEFLRGTPAKWWLAVDESLEYYQPPNYPGGWFSIRPIAEILPEDELIAPFYHAAFHQAVPGVLTALGLLATFSAILVALSGVSYNAANPVQPVTGIDTLINGLAGKFLSSIIALILSVSFTLVEKKVCERQIFQRIDSLRSLISSIFPVLSQTRILLDLQRFGFAYRSDAAPAAESVDSQEATADAGPETVSLEHTAELPQGDDGPAPDDLLSVAPDSEEQSPESIIQAKPALNDGSADVDPGLAKGAPLAPRFQL